MARPAKKDPGRTGPEVIDQHTPEMRRELAVVAADDREIKALDERLGFDEPYDREQMVIEATSAYAGFQKAGLVLGNILLRIRRRETHEGWTKCIAKIGIDERTARRFAAVALKFSIDSPGKRIIAERLSQTKLAEMLWIPDEALEDLAAGGKFDALTIDDIDRMSTRELKDALREAKKEAQQLEQQLERKDKKINELDRKASRLDKATFDEAVLEMLDELAALVNRADDALTTLYGGASRVKEYFKENGTRMDDETRARMNVIHGFVESHLKKLAKAIPSA